MWCDVDEWVLDNGSTGLRLCQHQGQCCIFSNVLLWQHYCLHPVLTLFCDVMTVMQFALVIQHIATQNKNVKRKENNKAVNKEVLLWRLYLRQTSHHITFIWNFESLEGHACFHFSIRCKGRVGWISHRREVRLGQSKFLNYCFVFKVQARGLKPVARQASNQACN